jgi:hypothetical protein
VWQGQIEPIPEPADVQNIRAIGKNIDKLNGELA